MGEGGLGTVADAMITCPTVHPSETTAERARGFFAGDHVHALLVVDGGVLRAVVERDDLVDAAPEVPAAALGRLGERTVTADADLAPVWSAMVDAGRRRVAVVDGHGRLLGLLCLKRSGRGFCSDEGVAARAAERAAAQG